MNALLALTAATRRECNAATGFVFDSINALGGWIDDVNMYSNMMTAVRFTLKENRLGTLIDMLAGEGISVDPGPISSEISKALEDTERACSLQISFLHDEPDLRRDVPAVPGY